MKITGTTHPDSASSPLVLLLFTVSIVVVFGQMRFDRTNSYSAEFSNVSGLRAGQFVRASGVEIGKVKTVQLIDGGRRARVDFSCRPLDPAVPVDDRPDPLPRPVRRPLPGAQARRGRRR